MQAYAIKAAREGKQQTSWLAPDERYEAGLKDFLQRILDREHAAEFITSFDALRAPGRAHRRIEQPDPARR